MTNIAIVTGASSGLGAKIVQQLAEGAFGPLDEVWAVSRRAERTSPRVRPFALDLTDPASFDVLEKALAETPGARVVLLVNNAGFGTFGDFVDMPAADNANMVRLLMLAPVELTYRALPYMGAGSRILNVSSVAAFMPQPGLATYSAAKRFVLDFSRALDAELGSVDIHVTALCPKFMRTGFLDHAGADDVAANMAGLTGFEDVERVARLGLRAAREGRALCIPSADMRAFYVAAKLLPYPLVLNLERALMGLGDMRERKRVP